MCDRAVARARAVAWLEDGELAAEPLPDADDRRYILFYESAEGGAGVLRRLVEDPGALAAVARRALDLLHFDPNSGKDLGGPPWRPERCEAACYDCLMSYRNQTDHRLLNRKLVAETLVPLAKSSVTNGTRRANARRAARPAPARGRL